tara:strand:+ start:160 stop:312 length:153 start_codon:yes stop_codon:yes gene_type:complete
MAMRLKEMLLSRVIGMRAKEKACLERIETGLNVGRIETRRAGKVARQFSA